jgi:micrococcal nuclease
MMRAPGTRRRAASVLTALLLSAAGAAGWWALRGPALDAGVVELVRVSDGDTLVVEDSQGREQKVRLIGVDAPELGTAASFRCALQAAELLEGASRIRVEAEPSRPLDKYGRTLGWVWVTGRDGQELLLNAELIDSGNAEVFPGTSRKVKYYDLLVD